MRVFRIGCAACALMLGLGDQIGAHVGPVFYAQQVDPATITIDGLGDDPGWNAPLWDLANTITKEKLGGNVTGGELPSDGDWNAILKVGWSAPPDNMLYFYSQVTDDHLNDDAVRNGDSWRNDELEILVDADHDGGNFNDVQPSGAIAQMYAIRMTEWDMPPGPASGEGQTRSFLYAPPERMWMSGPPWMVVEVQKPVGRVDVTYAYEGKLAIWDVAGDIPETSRRHINAPDRIIGLTFHWDDADAGVDTRDDQPGTQGPEGLEAWRDASHFSDFVLVPAMSLLIGTPPVVVLPGDNPSVVSSSEGTPPVQSPLVVFPSDVNPSEETPTMLNSQEGTSPAVSQQYGDERTVIMSGTSLIEYATWGRIKHQMIRELRYGTGPPSRGFQGNH